jgi:5-(carboxyamino)imidazole ribonucleotide mutase
MSKPLVGILMGSDSDWPTMKAAVEALKEFGIESEAQADYAQQAHARGLRVLIAGAGGAAHLAGVVAAFTPLPVIAVPIETKTLAGLDSLLAMVQMPSGVPVATVAIGGARNAGLLAVQILGSDDALLQAKILEFKARLAAESRARNQKIQGA